MNEFMKVLMSLSVSGTFLLLVVYFLKLFYKNRLSKRWQYYIWLIVALRFLLPLAPVGELFQKIPISDIIQDNFETNSNGSELNIQPLATENQAVVRNLPSNPARYLWIGWFMILIVCFTRKVTTYQNFRHHLKSTNQEIDDIEILNVLSDCEEKLGIKKAVQLYSNASVGSAMMVGFFHPQIILPAYSSTKKELSYIFMHELIHYQRLDLFCKWFIQLVICIHWFNPFAYLLGREMNKACELACDEKVISLLDEQEKKAYGDTLLSSVRKNQIYRQSLASLTLTEGAKQLKERLEAIHNYQKSSKMKKTAAALLTIFIGICFMTTGAYTAENQTAKLQQLSQEIPEAVHQAATNMVNREYETAMQEHYSNWRISDLTHVYTYQNFYNLQLEIYQINYQFLANNPNELMLAGGMTMDEDGWVSTITPNSIFLIFRQDNSDFYYVGALRESDCIPGDELFTNDLETMLTKLKMMGLMIDNS